MSTLTMPSGQRSWQPDNDQHSVSDGAKKCEEKLNHAQLLPRLQTRCATTPKILDDSAIEALAMIQS